MMERAPDFCLPSLRDQSSVCLKDYRGKVVLLSFWVTWCPSCQTDQPKKEVLFRNLRHPDFVFLTVNVTGREAEPEKVPAYIEKMGFQFPVLADRGREVYDAFGIQSVPASVLIDRDGQIVGVYDETVPFPIVVGEIGRLLET
jgi:peroxiredoxin